MTGLLLSACGGSPAPRATGPVAVPPSLRTLSDEQAAVCGRVTAALPATIGSGLARRPVTGDGATSAAWGDPPVTLACGVGAASPLDQQVQLGPPSGGLVTFAVDDVGAATAYTTVGLPVTVTVTVPDRYDATLLVPVSAALLAADR